MSNVSFPLCFKLLSCASRSEIEDMNGFKQLISVTFLFGKISLNEQKTEV